MISIEAVVYVVLFLFGCAAIFGLLFLACNYIEKQFPTTALFMKFVRIFLFIAAVFVLIFLILDLMGHPVIEWRSRRDVVKVQVTPTVLPDSPYHIQCGPEE